MHYHDRINLITNKILQKYTYYWPMISLFDQNLYECILKNHSFEHRIDIFFAKGSEANKQAPRDWKIVKIFWGQRTHKAKQI